jgi:glycosyltransferase involved in cell wall biosynthesis
LKTQLSYAIVSYENRRDLHDPLRFFEVLRPTHLFQKAPYKDIDLEGQFRNPAELYRKLTLAQPQIVQGGEPFVRRLVPYTWAVTAYCKLKRVPLVVPSVENIPVADKYGDAWAAAVRGSVRPYVRSAALAIAVNAGAENNLRWAGVRPERMVRMMYGAWGVDTSEFTPEGSRAQLPGKGHPIVVLGRLERIKGVFDLVAAMPKVLESVNADLVFIGDGSDAEDLKQAARDAGVGDHVHFLGVIQNSEVPYHLRAAAVLAAPSRTTRKWAEQVGMSAIQALACGVPVVTTASGSIAEFIHHGVTGLVVPEGMPDALADALTRFLANGVMRGEYARRARAEAVRRFDARTNIRAAEQKILQACGYA